MFFFGYQCCMRKNYITHNIPSYPFDEEDATIRGPAQGDKDSVQLVLLMGIDCTFAFFSFILLYSDFDYVMTPSSYNTYSFYFTYAFLLNLLSLSLIH